MRVVITTFGHKITVEKRLKALSEKTDVNMFMSTELNRDLICYHYM